MMDEPFASLDTKLRGEMRRFIRSLQQRLRLTTIFVTHDQAEAMELADRVAVILDGRLTQYDRPDVLYSCPNSVAVADFMGVSNIFSGKLVAKNRAETAFGAVQVNGAQHAAPGDVVKLLLRAEAIDLLERREDARHQAIEGIIIARDFLGASVAYTVACGPAHINVNEQSRRLLDIKQRVWLDIPPERVWLVPK